MGGMQRCLLSEPTIKSQLVPSVLTRMCPLRPCAYSAYATAGKRTGTGVRHACGARTIPVQGGWRPRCGSLLISGGGRGLGVAAARLLPCRQELVLLCTAPLGTSALGRGCIRPIRVLCARPPPASQFIVSPPRQPENEPRRLDCEYKTKIPSLLDY